MTNIRFYAGPVDMNAWDPNLPGQGWFNRSVSPTYAHYFDESGSSYEDFWGIGLGDSGGDYLTSGTITDYLWVEDGSFVKGFSGGSVDVATLDTAISSGNIANVWAVILPGNDIINGSAFSDSNIFGGLGNDSIYGNGGADKLFGQGGADKLFGGSGKDVLSGGAGNDRLHGGAGADILTGGTGRDIFIFDAALAAGTNIDKLSDFKHVDDTIYLSHNIFAALGAVGTLVSSAYVIGSAATDAADRIIYNSATGALLYDADGSMPIMAAVQFATLQTGLANLANDDFVIV